MNTKDQAELNLLEGEMTNASGGVTDMELPEEDDDVNPLNADGMDDSGDTMPMTAEREEMEDNQESSKEEGERAHVPKEEGEEEVSEDGTEEAFGEEEDEDDEEEEGGEEEEMRDGEADEEGDTLNEPEDLSLADYAHYESTALRDAHAGGAYAPGGAGASRGQAAGKLSCDICGLSCVSINVLLVHKRSHTGERPFHCAQCGASFTQKGNLLRHIKLHSGEKPFKCPMCSYACRRRDALSGHLRTHSVEKPFKCNHCGRSYKQRSSLEEHRERCHVYIQSKGHAEREDGSTVRTQMGTERALLLDRLASNVAKRKSSMPQKFTGDNGVCLDLSFSREGMDPPRSSPGADTHHPPHHHNHHQHQQQQQTILTPDPDTAPSHRAYPIPLAFTNGHKLGLPNPRLGPSPQGHSGLDALHGDGPQVTQPLVYGLGHLLGGPNPHNGLPHPHRGAQAVPMPPLEVLRVVRGDGEVGVLPGAMYPCSHCRVVFLDYVMFTIHMGCHGFRDPLECNMCGHRSRDRYEFSSHIARGEHRLELKS